MRAVFTKSRTSSMRIRPRGPRPVTFVRSTPSSLANRLSTAGLAWKSRKRVGASAGRDAGGGGTGDLSSFLLSPDSGEDATLGNVSD